MRWSRKPPFEGKIKVVNAEIEFVYSFKYFGTMVYSSNVIE